MSRMSEAFDALDRRRWLSPSLAGCVEAELRDVTSAIDGYLRPFAAGTMSDTVCASRVKELSAEEAPSSSVA